MRGTDRLMDVLHDAYEQLIRWIFSADWLLAACGRRLGAARDARRGAAAIAACVSFAAAASRRVALRRWSAPSSFRRRDQGFTQLAIRLPVGSSLERSDAKIRQVEQIVAGFPEIDSISTSIGGQGSGLAVGRNQATLNLGLKPRAERKRSQKQVEDALARAACEDPRHRTVGRIRPADLRGDSRQRARDAGTHRNRVRREGEADSRHRRPGVVGEAGPAGLRGAAEARRGARARPHGDRSSRRACAHT